MEKTTLDLLIESINHNPSEYEEKWVRWVSIGYDKEMLIKFLYELKYLKEQDPQDLTKIAIFEEILNSHKPERLLQLLQNDPTASRLALIEKWARIAAMELLIQDKYSIETLNTITQFPLGDYQLIVRRTQELMSMISDITTQASALIEGVPGV